MRVPALFVFGTVLLLVLLLAACGGSKQPAADSGPTPVSEASLQQGNSDSPAPAPASDRISGRIVPGLQPAGDLSAGIGSSLASPRDVLSRLSQKDRSTSFTQSEGHKDGAEFANLLPNDNVTIGGSALSFAPNYAPGSLGLNGLAYAIYDFSLPSAQSGLLGSFNWGLDPAQGSLFLGLGNFDSNRWEWMVPIEITALNLQACQPYIDDGTDRFLLVVALSGTASASLTEIQLEGVEPPLPDLTADVASGLIPLDVNFDGSGSFDPDGSIVSYEWDFDGDGNFGETGDEADNANVPDPPVVTYSSAGSFDATLRVTDDDGASAQAMLTITTNIAPTVQLDADITVGNQPLEVTFTATPADANGSITTIEWDLDGNGSFNAAAEEQAANGDATPLPYTYSSPGSYDVKVRVFDNQGVSAEDSINVQVGSPPQVDLNADVTSGPKPLTVTFTADATDPGGSIDDVEWDYDGDGIFNENTNGELAAKGDLTPTPHTYTITAERDPVVRVTDNDGGSASDTIHISITNTPPTADLQSSPGTEGDAPFIVTFDASGSTDAGGSVVDYEWDFDGDNIYNEAGTEAAAQGFDTPADETFSNPGVYSVHLRVTDDDGATDVTSLDITSHGWLVINADDPPGNPAVNHTNITLVNGRPAIAYVMIGSGVRYGLSATALGGSPSDWAFLTVPGNPGEEISLVEVSTGPAIAAYSPAQQDLIYQVANGDGTSNVEWGSVITVASAGVTGRFPDVRIVSGNPAIVYNGSSPASLLYVRSTTASGAAQSDWSINSTIQAAGAGENIVSYETFAVPGGNPAVVYYYYDNPNDQLRFCRSGDALGDNDADWSAKFDLDNSNGSGAWYSYGIKPVGGFPAAIFRNNAGATIFRQSTNTGGTAWNAGVTVAAAGEVGSFGSFGVIGATGHPALAYQTNAGGDVKYVRSSTASGSMAADWSTVETVDSANYVGGHIQMVELDDRPALVYVDATTGLVKYAIKI